MCLGFFTPLVELFMSILTLNFCLLCVGLFAPLVGFLTLTALYKVVGRQLTGVIACGTILLSLICFTSILFTFLNEGMNPQKFTLFQWIHVDGVNADFILRIDSLTILMTLIITGVGFLIHVYSNGYMDHDSDYVRFFACMNFFVFSMLLLVLAGDLLLLFVGWEGVGLASYLLIGFYYQKPSAAQAATKAFVINRIGDLGLLIGLLLTYTLFGTSDISEISQRAVREFAIGAPIISVLTLLYFIGATGKSAQLPLYTWLPDAMEGPTPVSALIHAATMVTAGVYLVVRMHPVFMLAPWTLHLMGAIGGITALFAALCAVGQTDLKRVLAYSTISQLGYMFLACGTGAFYAAMFHLTNHAFMKALLFLAAGNVVHMMHDTTEMGKMGGLKRIFTKTHWLFLVGVLAMSGVPPLAAFFSKDLILEQEYLAGFETLFYIGLIAAVITAFYLTRAYCLTFLGKEHFEDKSIKEAPSIMLIPVTILAILSIVGGFLGFAFGRIPVLERFLATEVGITHTELILTTSSVFTPETFLSVAGALLGIISAAIMYTKYADRFQKPVEFLKHSFYVNEIYRKVLVVPLQALSRFITHVIEPKVFDASVKDATYVTQGAAQWLQQFESGQIRSYVAWMVIGSVCLTLYFIQG